MWTSAFQKSGVRKQLDLLYDPSNPEIQTTCTLIYLQLHTKLPRTKYHRSEIHISVSLLHKLKTPFLSQYPTKPHTLLHFSLSLVGTMATSAIQNPEVRSESKSAKKKKAKADAASVASVAHVETVSTADSTNGDGSYESPYIKELYK